MKNVKFEIPEHTQKTDEDLINKIMEETTIRDFLAKNRMDRQFVAENIYPFKRWADSLKKCEGCRGLDECRQDNEGFHFECSSGKLLTLGLVSCSYKQAHSANQKHIKNYKINDLPKDWAGKSFADLDLKKENAAYRALVYQALDYCDNTDQKGLFLYGNVGVGKSMLAALVCNDLAKQGKKVAFIHVPTMCSRMKSYIGEDEFDEQLYWMKNVDFLVMDDIGAESATPWIRDELLLPVLNYRMENKMATWFTSNEDFDSLFDHYRSCGKIAEEMKAVRIMERVKSLAKSVNFSGKNRRNIEN